MPSLAVRSDHGVVRQTRDAVVLMDVKALAFAGRVRVVDCGWVLRPLALRLRAQASLFLEGKLGTWSLLGASRLLRLAV